MSDSFRILSNLASSMPSFQSKQILCLLNLKKNKKFKDDPKWVRLNARVELPNKILTIENR